MVAWTRNFPMYGSQYDGKTFTTLVWLSNSFFSISKSDPVRRVRPKGAVALFENATSANTNWYEKRDSTYMSDSSTAVATKGAFTTYSISDTIGGLGGSYTPPPSVDSAAFNRMLADARESSVNLGQMLAEFRQTAKLFPELAIRLVSLVTKLKKGRNLSQLRRDLNNIHGRRWDSKLANDWLQFQYGVKPLIGDMQDSIERLKEGLKSKPLVSYCRGTSRINNGERVLATGGLMGTRYGRYTTTESSDSKITYKGMYVVSNENVNAMAGSLGFTNPLALAWELLPFSFVVDWWVNVGEVIESLDNPLYFSNLKAIRSERTNFYRRVAAANTVATYEWHQLSRSKASAYSTFARPRWKPDTNMTHVANGLALLRGLTRVR